MDLKRGRIYVVVISPSDFVRIIRPHQWTKNLLILAPPFFGAVLFFDKHLIINMTVAFFAFSFASSSGYMINDLFDIKTDRLHPQKKHRPIPSGRVGTTHVLVLVALMLCLSLALSLTLGLQFILLILLYLSISLLYSLYLQHVPILDAFSISSGFVIRIGAGGNASGVEISSWLYLTTFLLSLLLAFGKRRYELSTLENSGDFRKVLSDYSTGFLDSATGIFATISIVTYSLYTVDRGPKSFILTVPFACYGVLRYLYLVQSRQSGDPTEALLSDKWLFLCVFLWIVLTALIVYFPDFFRFFF
ncbi:MAG: decaprenyl-phosphate phosphoribosyltransferase [Thermodesulfobacteriota bacterium]